MVRPPACGGQRADRLVGLVLVEARGTAAAPPRRSLERNSRLQGLRRVAPDTFRFCTAQGWDVPCARASMGNRPRHQLPQGNRVPAPARPGASLLTGSVVVRLAP